MVNDFLNSEKFYPGQASKYPQVRQHLDHVFELISTHFTKHKEPKRHREFLRTILLALVKRYAHDPESYVHFSRRRDDFSPGKYYSKLRLDSYPIFIRIIDALIAAGLIEYTRGYFDRIVGQGHSSRMRMSPRLAEILGMAPGQPTQAIQSANIILRAGTDTCADRKSRDFTPYPQDPQYKKAKLILAMINLANSRLPVQLNLTPQESLSCEVCRAVA